MDALGVVLVHWHLAKMLARSVKACLRGLFAAFMYITLFNLRKILSNTLDWMGLCGFGVVAFACRGLLISVKVDFHECVTGSLIGEPIAQFLMLFPNASLCKCVLRGYLRSPSTRCILLQHNNRLNS